MTEIQADLANKPPVTLGTMIIYGLGRSAEAIKSRVFETFLFFYYVQVLEVPGSYAGIAVGIALAFDAVTDPIIGSFSDRFHSRWGRRHPFMALSVIPLSITFLLLMIPPDNLDATELAIWLCIFAVLVRGSITLFHVPHLSLAPEMVTEYDKRTNLVIVRNIMLIIGSATAFFVGFSWFFAATPEFETGQLNAAAYPPYAITMTLIMVACILLCVYGTREHIPYLATPPVRRQFQIADIFRDLTHALKSPSFRSICLGMLFYAVYSGVHSTMNLHLGTYYWELSPREFTFYAIAVTVGAVAGLPVAYFVVAKYDKKPAYISLVSVSVIFVSAPVTLRLVDWFPTNDSPYFLPVYLFMTFIGLTAALAAGTASASMVMDTTDEHEMNTGLRQEGAFYGAVSLSGKAASAMGHVIGGFIIDLIRFPLGSDVKPGMVDADIIWQLGLYYGPVVALLPVATVYIVSRQYTITRKRHTEILDKLSR
ncbi:MAG: MFS transporter [Gammaproteobacteria bacterium]|nr:MFS transporter [Gammaproteobacteria bacterium]